MSLILVTLIQYVTKMTEEKIKMRKKCETLNTLFFNKHLICFFTPFDEQYILHGDTARSSKYKRSEFYNAEFPQQQNSKNFYHYYKHVY